MTNDWPQPIAFGDYNLPAFPDSALPDIFRDYARAIAETHQVPIDLPATLMLAAGGLPLANRVEVEIAPGWQEPCNLYVLTALDSGHQKSPVMNRVSAPFREYERRENERLRPLIEDNAQQRRIMEARLKKAEQAVANAKVEDREQAWEYARQLRDEMPTERHALQLLADDVTPENLATLIANNSERMAIMSAEGGPLEMMAGRYSNKDIPNLDVYLKSYSGDMLRVNRQGQSARFIDSPLLTLALAVQPEMLITLTEKPGFRGKGLLARFLYSKPESMFGRRLFMQQSIDPAIRHRYDNHLLHQLTSLEAMTRRSDGSPWLLRLSDDALQLLSELLTSNERDMAPGGRLEHLRDWGGKRVGTTARIASILHSVSYPVAPWDAAISADTMASAIAISEYFVEHALAAFDQMGMDTATEAARHVLDWIKRTASDTFTARDVHQALKGRYRKAAELHPAFGILIERGYIIEVSSKKTGPGRPPQRFAVNPNTHEINSHYSQKTYGG